MKSEYFERTLQWGINKNHNLEYPFISKNSGELLIIKTNDFPEKPLFSLVDGKKNSVLFDFDADEWPSKKWGDLDTLMTLAKNPTLKKTLEHSRGQPDACRQLMSMLKETYQADPTRTLEIVQKFMSSHDLSIKPRSKL